MQLEQSDDRLIQFPQWLRDSKWHDRMCFAALSSVARELDDVGIAISDVRPHTQKDIGKQLLSSTRCYELGLQKLGDRL